MDFFLFLLVNATLFIRPAEIIPALNAWPIYNYVILANLIVAAPAIINHLTSSNLSQKPATVCVLGVLAAIFLSHAVRSDLWSARMGAFEFAKVVAYFLILVSTVTTTRRLATFLAVVASLTIAINLLAVLHYRGVIEIPSLTVLMQNDYDPLTGEGFLVPRMQATGIFGDPNDLSMIIVAGIFIFACGMFYGQFGPARFLLAAPIGFLGYALTLTQSRGGLLALLVGCGVVFYSKFGAMRAGMLAAAGFPVLLAGFGGRQVDFSSALTGGTGASRAEHWADGLQALKASPIFGVGHNMYAEYAGGFVAHNSFVHALTELGFVGGVSFLGLFAILGWSLWKLNSVKQEVSRPGMRHLFPYMAAMFAAYCVSLMSLSRCYTAPTYLIAGIATSYVTLVQPLAPVPAMRLDGRVLKWLLIGSVGFIAFIYLYIKVLVRMG